MSEENKKSELIEFHSQRSLIKFRGIIMLGIGTLICVGSLIAPNVAIMSMKNAWLPVAAFVIFLVGIIELFDSYISRNTSRFFVNIQFAIMDTIIGFVLFFSLDYPANMLSLLIAVFLMIKGTFRIIGAKLGKFVNGQSTLIGGGISFVLGFFLWVQWPLEPSAVLLSFCISLEIALRGWALIQFADWLGSHELDDSIVS